MSARKVDGLSGRSLERVLGVLLLVLSLVAPASAQIQRSSGSRLGMGSSLSGSRGGGSSLGTPTPGGIGGVTMPAIGKGPTLRPEPGTEELAAYESLRQRALQAVRRLPEVAPDQPQVAKRISYLVGKALDLADPRVLHKVYPESDDLREIEPLRGLSSVWVTKVADYLLAEGTPELTGLPFPSGDVVEDFIVQAERGAATQEAQEHRVEAIRLVARLGSLEAGWGIDLERLAKEWKGRLGSEELTVVWGGVFRGLRETVRDTPGRLPESLGAASAVFEQRASRGVTPPTGHVAGGFAAARIESGAVTLATAPARSPRPRPPRSPQPPPTRRPRTRPASPRAPSPPSPAPPSLAPSPPPPATRSPSPPSPPTQAVAADAGTRITSDPGEATAGDEVRAGDAAQDLEAPSRAVTPASSPSPTQRERPGPPPGFFVLVGLIGILGGPALALLWFRFMAKDRVTFEPGSDPSARPAEDPDAVLPLHLGHGLHTFEIWRKNSGELLVRVDKRMLPGQLEQPPGQMSRDSTTRFQFDERSLLAHALDGHDGFTYDVSLDGLSLTTGQPIRPTTTALGPALIAKILFAVVFVAFPLGAMALQGGAAGAGIGFTAISICFGIERQKWAPLWVRYLSCILVVLCAWFLFIQIVGFALGFLDGWNAARGS